MPKTKSLNPPRRTEIQIPSDLYLRMSAELFSTVENCVPYGAFSKFIAECIREHYENRNRVNALPGESRGAPAGYQHLAGSVMITDLCGRCGAAYDTAYGCSCSEDGT